MMRDLASRISAVSALAVAAYSADTTPVSIDLQGFNSALILINVGAGGITFSGSNKVEFVLTHSDDDSTYTNVTDADLQGVTGVTNGIVRSLTSAKAAADTSPTKIGYIGGKRYLQLLADFSGTHGTATPMCATVIKGAALYGPTA